MVLCHPLNNGMVYNKVVSYHLYYLIFILIDSLIDKISKSNLGCKLGIIQSNIIVYADDIVLLSPSSIALQNLFIYLCLNRFVQH